jgi:hypothetical protein
MLTRLVQGLRRCAASFGWVLVLLLLTTRSGASEYILELVRDGAGRLWGLTSEGLAWLEGDAWPSQTDEALQGATPHNLTALRDGSVACLWTWQPGAGQKSALTRHKGESAQRITEIPVTLVEPLLLERADGSLLITEKGLSVVEISQQGAVRVTTIPRELFQRKREGGPDEPFANQVVRATEDAHHRVWLWTNALLAGEGSRVLKGLVGYEPGRCEARPLPGLDFPQGVSAVLSGDAHHLWVAKMGTGIHAVDLETLRSELITRPLPERNQTDNVEYIEDLFAIGGERFAITSPRPTTYPTVPDMPSISGGILISMDQHYRDELRTGRLLHYENGHWVELVEGLDRSPSFASAPRPRLMTPAGLLIGSRYGGPWLVRRPDGKPPVQHDWKTNFPLRDARQFVAEDEGKMRLIDTEGKMAVCAIEPPVRAAPLRCSEFQMELPLLSDAAGHLWGFRGDQFTEWQGERWVNHEKPVELLGEVERARWWADDRGRGWLLVTAGKAASFDFATGEWKVYRSREDALVSQLYGGMNLRNLNDPFLSPVYSGDGRIAYLTLEDGLLHYYDGFLWRHSRINDMGTDRHEVDGGPFFEGGRLCLPLGGATQVWDPKAEKWEQRERKEPPKLTIKEEKEPLPAPEGCPVEKPTSIDCDAYGVTWLTSPDGKLYKAAGGRSVEVFAEGEPNPFHHGLQIYRPKIDALGNAVLERLHAYNPYDFIMIKATIPLPKVTASIKEFGADRVRIGFTTNLQPPAEVWYSWRLDDGEWQSLQHGAEVLRRNLAPGRHTIQVRAYNAELGTGREPAAVEWTTPPPP